MTGYRDLCLRFFDIVAVFVFLYICALSVIVAAGISFYLFIRRFFRNFFFQKRCEKKAVFTCIAFQPDHDLRQLIQYNRNRNMMKGISFFLQDLIHIDRSHSIAGKVYHRICLRIHNKDLLADQIHILYEVIIDKTFNERQLFRSSFCLKKRLTA